MAQVVKESSCLPAMQETWFDSWVGTIPWRRAQLPTQYSCLEDPMDREPGGLQSTQLQQVRQNGVTNTFMLVLKHQALLSLSLSGGPRSGITDLKHLLARCKKNRKC